MKSTYCRACIYIIVPKYQSGFTGKSGPETWWGCGFHRKHLRNVKKCDNIEMEVDDKDIKDKEKTIKEHGELEQKKNNGKAYNKSRLAYLDYVIRKYFL